jgi:hypothetical protein
VSRIDLCGMSTGLRRRKAVVPRARQPHRPSAPRNSLGLGHDTGSRVAFQFHSGNMPTFLVLHTPGLTNANRGARY